MTRQLSQPYVHKANSKKKLEDSGEKASSYQKTYDEADNNLYVNKDMLYSGIYFRRLIWVKTRLLLDDPRI